ncbi:MAG: pyruvate kinase alpha/beta domain-containing protein, partial [Actinomycetota bacterium]
ATATKIAKTVEARGDHYRATQPACRHTGEAAAVAHAAASISGDADVRAITCYTETGRTARLLSAERPGCPIYAFMPDVRLRRSNALLWGVTALPATPPRDTDEMIELMDHGLQEHGLVRPGESVVMAASSPAGRTTTNMLKIHQVGGPIR